MLSLPGCLMLAAHLLAGERSQHAAGQKLCRAQGCLPSWQPEQGLSVRDMRLFHAASRSLGTRTLSQGSAPVR